jgi:hypothetical protein
MYQHESAVWARGDAQSSVSAVEADAIRNRRPGPAASCSGLSPADTATTRPVSPHEPDFPRSGDTIFEQTVMDSQVPNYDFFSQCDGVWGKGQNCDAAELTFDDFLVNNGAWRPAVPCIYCSRLRLQCFILQTTSANPNPITSCSSCVALFRACSFAEGGGKRQASEYETPQPVIGHLHGVNEEDNHLVANSVLADKRAGSRSVRKTRALRSWFACHLDNPYPSEGDKVSLAKESGLTKTQVVNWFTNARRRHRLSTQGQSKNIFPSGSPMPESYMSDLSPLDRWRHSPPDEEPASASAIEQALDLNFSHNATPELYHHSDTNLGTSSVSGDSASFPHRQWHPKSPSSASSCFSNLSIDNQSVFGLSIHGSEEHAQLTFPAFSSDRPTDSRLFRCSFCLRSFTKKSDRVRHERSVHHLDSKTSWICGIPLPEGQGASIWRVGEHKSECIFCGQISPTEEHFHSHEFESCAERPVADRSFLRKDHLWQHLFKFHSCRKWDGWKPDLDLLKKT